MDMILPANLVGYLLGQSCCKGDALKNYIAASTTSSIHEAFCFREETQGRRILLLSGLDGKGRGSVGVSGASYAACATISVCRAETVDHTGDGTCAAVSHQAHGPGICGLLTSL
jgi:hypothetical protein